MNQNLAGLDRFTELPGVNFKVVVFYEEDLIFARKVHAFYPHMPLYLQVGNDTEGLIAGETRMAQQTSAR